MFYDLECFNSIFISIKPFEFQPQFRIFKNPVLCQTSQYDTLTVIMLPSSGCQWELKFCLLEIVKGLDVATDVYYSFLGG